MASLDMTDILLEAYQLADMIESSEEMVRYLEAKKRLEEDQEAQKLIRRFQEKKERFEECQRFGHFHPDYHDARKKARAFQKEMIKYPLIQEYLDAEQALDLLLAGVSQTIAYSVSETIKVPAVNQKPTLKKRNCG